MYFFSSDFIYFFERKGERAGVRGGAEREGFHKWGRLILEAQRPHVLSVDRLHSFTYTALSDYGSCCLSHTSCNIWAYQRPFFITTLIPLGASFSLTSLRVCSQNFSFVVLLCPAISPFKCPYIKLLNVFSELPEDCFSKVRVIWLSSLFLSYQIRAVEQSHSSKILVISTGSLSKREST